MDRWDGKLCTSGNNPFFTDSIIIAGIAFTIAMIIPITANIITITAEMTITHTELDHHHEQEQEEEPAKQRPLGGKRGHHLVGLSERQRSHHNPVFEVGLQMP